MKKIVLTGGGTAGHVNPNIALMPSLKEHGYDISYIGSKNGIEKELIENTHTPYYEISTGKLRRYFDTKNFTDAFRVIKGLSDADKWLRTLKPDVIFSKGGYVSVPVVLSAARHKIPVIIHESDITPGLANKISFRYAKKICCSFPETVDMLPSNKAVLSGSPIRAELFSGDANKGLEFCGLDDSKPLLLVMGGSIGSVAINNAIRHALPKLLEEYNIAHLCGKGHIDETLSDTKGYAQFEYINEQLPDVMAATSIMVSRSGANAISEILALRIPHILIPLPSASSRGDQLLNAKSYEKQGFSYVLNEEDTTNETLIEALGYVSANRDTYIEAMNSGSKRDSISIIIDLIENEYEQSHRR